ncbi:MarR family transcriptional regulator [Achromobacter sp. 77]|jgi:DNA-binding MarR family transcriptional regulator|uniref:MarR family winged helix-turn-helix transcriptional regulator n=1 Tax=Achromobacter TaxID=222 RepID=UPI001D011B25|nr:MULTISPECIES: MarR family transcriptional regulator [Achromobacter]MCU6618936.1 MarR family transcriptional regulator [Achromobacter mucicolens]UDG77728.1 MarR family transcriptional regulator [Achromobacter sp. 77]
MNDRARRAQEEWQRERPDIDANVMALVGRLLQATHLLERNWFLPLAAQFELHQGEFDVIATLRRSGNPYAMTPTDLHEGLMLSSGAMTSRLDRLERKGLIERVPSPNDRRSTLVRLTPAGLALIDKLLPLHVANEQQALASLTQKEQAQLDGLLAKLLVGLGRKPGD